MKRNIGRIDKILRITLGLIILGGSLAFYFLYQNQPVWHEWQMWSVVGTVIGTIFVGSGLVSYCPVYASFNISSMDNDLNNS